MNISNYDNLMFFKGNILYFEEISPEKYNLKQTIRLYLGEKPCWWQ